MNKKEKNHFHNFMEVDSKKQSLKSKKIEVENYMIKYKKAKLKLGCIENLSAYSTNTAKEKEQLLSYISYIDKVITSLTFESKEYFLNEFLCESYNPSWWEEKYNKVHFAKVRNYALNEFLLYVQ